VTPDAHPASATSRWKRELVSAGGLRLRSRFRTRPHNDETRPSVHAHGSDEQKQRWLPAMARLDAIGAFALTEPSPGSDSVALETTARRDGDGWVLDGAKHLDRQRSIADVVVVWARAAEDGQVKGFLVAKDSPGFEARTTEGKGVARAIWQADIHLDDVRVGDDARLPGAERSRTPAA
jgi:glutaryl-CoA dehydrogenase